MIKEVYKWIISLILLIGFLYGIYIFILKSLFLYLGIQSMSAIPIIYLILYYSLFAIIVLILSFICIFLITKVIHFYNKIFLFITILITLIFTILIFKSAYAFVSFYKASMNINVGGLNTLIQTLPQIQYIYINMIMVSIIYFIFFITPFILNFRK